MSDSAAEIESLNGLDAAMLNKQGWHMVTHYLVREGADGSKAYNNAVQKVQHHNRHAGIRTIIKEGVTYHEIWDFWK